MCESDSPADSNSKSKKDLLVGAVAGGLVGVVIVALLILVVRGCKREATFSPLMNTTINEVYSIDSEDSDDYEGDVTNLSQINLDDVDSDEDTVYSSQTISNMKAAMDRPPSNTAGQNGTASPQNFASQGSASLLTNDDAEYSRNGQYM